MNPLLNLIPDTKIPAPLQTNFPFENRIDFDPDPNGAHKNGTFRDSAIQLEPSFGLTLDLNGLLKWLGNV